MQNIFTVLIKNMNICKNREKIFTAAKTNICKTSTRCLKDHCHVRFQSALTAFSSDFFVITLVWSDQYFNVKTARVTIKQTRNSP